MGTSISGAVIQLETLLLAAVAAGSGTSIEGVQVAWDDPDNYERKLVIAFRGVVAATEIAAALGQQSRDENFGIALRVKAHLPDKKEPRDAHLRGFAIADGIRDVLRTNMTLNGTVRYAAITSQATDNAAGAGAGAYRAEGGGSAIYIDLVVGCTQRIS